MLRLPSRFGAAILCFAPLFRERSWRHAEVLLVGAILAPGRRTVTSILRITGLTRERRFVNYHRILRRHKTLADWARQPVLQARGWLPDRPLILVADSGSAALEFLPTLVRRGVTCITRLRLDAALYRPV